jgi:hypothetical protein
MAQSRSNHKRYRSQGYGCRTRDRDCGKGSAHELPMCGSGAEHAGNRRGDKARYNGAQDQHKAALEAVDRDDCVVMTGDKAVTTGAQ